MAEIQPEPVSWDAPPDAEKAAAELRDGLARAKARMKEHREVMRAAGLTSSEDEPPQPQTLQP
jgi:hypothetical protein